MNKAEEFGITALGDLLSLDGFRAVRSRGIRRILQFTCEMS